MKTPRFFTVLSFSLKIAIAIWNCPAPENYSHPEPIRIWESGGSFFNYAPVQLGERVLKPGKTYPFRYRFIVHDGDIDPDLAERMWQQYAHPVTTRIVHD